MFDLIILKDKICYQPFRSIYPCCEKVILKYGLKNANSSTCFNLASFYSSQSHITEIVRGKAHFQEYKSYRKALTKFKNAVLSSKYTQRPMRYNLLDYFTVVC